VTVQRCPTCGRAWDNRLCFACGHDASTAPASATVAPTPKEPALSSRAAPAAPTEPSSRAASAAPREPSLATRTPSKTPSSTVAARPVAPPASTAPGRAATGPAVAASMESSTPAHPASAPPAPASRPASGPATLDDDLHTQPTMTLTRPYLVGDRDDGNATPAFVRRLPPGLRRLWDGPGIFPASFGAGFVVSFALLASLSWRGPSMERMLAEGRADQLLASLPAERPTPSEALWRGHALGLKDRHADMLRAYQIALAGGAIDGRALDNTIEALGQARSRPLAVQLLVSWNDDELDARLLTVAGHGNHERRHGAVDALNGRASASPERRLRAAVLVAVADVVSDVCDEKVAGVAALAGLAELPRARSHLRELQAWKAVYDQNTGRVLDECRKLDDELVRKTETALGAVERR